MKDLLAEIRRALAGCRRRPLPPPLAQGEEEGAGALAALFAERLEAAGGRWVPLAAGVTAAQWLDRQRAGASVHAGDAPDEAALRRAETGVDRADWLVAETGTIVRTYRTRAEARVSLVPPVSVFLADPTRLVADLDQALERLADGHRRERTYTLFITGPSRTADIEKRLVIPAHGPREVVVLFSAEASGREDEGRP